MNSARRKETLARVAVSMCVLAGCGTRSGLGTDVPVGDADVPPDTTADAQADVARDLLIVPPLPVPIRQLSLGAFRSCALRVDGVVLCWGASATGPFKTELALLPAVLREPADIVELSLGTAHHCARQLGGRAVCWGSNIRGELGDGTRTDRRSPAPPAGLGVVTQIATGELHTCALRPGGSVACWGAGYPVGTTSDPLADSEDDQLVPRTVTGVTDAIALAARYKTCALRVDGTVICWGEGLLVPEAVGGLAAIVEIGLGMSHGCARRNDGAVLCWGDNHSGQLGDGSTAKSDEPVLVPTLGAVAQIAVGQIHSCALRNSGTVVCWGANNHAQLGNGTSTIDGYTPCPPTEALGLSDIVEIASGLFHVCARRRDNAVFCWGLNGEGQIGDGTCKNRRLLPTRVKL